jgi:aspartate/methionine/tyrosine aminotransferase
MVHRDYTTISVGVLDDALASLALSRPALPRLLARNNAIVSATAARVAAWVAAERGRAAAAAAAGGGKTRVGVTWAPPEGGTVALLHFSRGGGGGEGAAPPPLPSSEELCLRLLRERRALLVPGSAFGVAGTCARIGLGNPAAAIEAGLRALTALLDDL